MRKSNAWTKFFTADLIPDENEIGNSFWGYHIANNIGRLLNLDGTVFFSAIGTSLSKPSELYDISVARIPIEMCGFSTAPVIQLAAQVDIPPNPGTMYYTGTFDGGLLNKNITDYDRLVQIRYDNWIFDEGEPLSNCFMKLGTANEVMQILDYAITSMATCVLVDYGVNRNVIAGGTAYSYNGEAEAVQCFRTNNDGIQTVAPTSGESQYTINPVFVEAVIDPTQLKIFWGHDAPGTVYFKIFGV